MMRKNTEPGNLSSHFRKLHGRKKGKKLKGRQYRLIQEVLPQLLLHPESIVSDENKGMRLDPQTFFAPPPSSGKINLEIGFGGGEHLSFQMDRNPDEAFIGCEPYINGMAKFLALREDAGHFRNIRVYNDDAADILKTLRSASVHRVFLLYPDPWPKKKHHKRRFVSLENLHQIARVLKPGGRFLFVSDIESYIEWTLWHVTRTGLFDWQASNPEDWRQPPADWPGTRYEAKALREGRKGHYLLFTKKQIS